VSETDVVGAKNTPTSECEIVFSAARLSVTVGTDPASKTVPWVRSVGPILRGHDINKKKVFDMGGAAHPRIPS
jgi:hypothetical protein